MMHPRAEGPSVVTGDPDETGGRGPIADVSTIGRRAVTAAEGGSGLVPALVIASHVVASRAGERLLLEFLEQVRK
jgi:hypothetical protein